MCVPLKERSLDAPQSLLREKVLRNRRRSHTLIRREITPCQAFINEFESLFGTEACGLGGATIDCSSFSVESLTPLLGAKQAVSFLKQCPVLAQSAHFFDVTCALINAARTIEVNGYCRAADVPKPGPSALARRKGRRTIALDNVGTRTLASAGPPDQGQGGSQAIGDAEALAVILPPAVLATAVAGRL